MIQAFRELLSAGVIHVRSKTGRRAVSKLAETRRADTGSYTGMSGPAGRASVRPTPVVVREPSKGDVAEAEGRRRGRAGPRPGRPNSEGSLGRHVTC
jgi:hypothetical protein